jgi:7-carboxy-7-deazaguanine synthase
VRVFEIFRSIQGETTRVGLAMHFVRLAGCDLACAYCDTAAARDPAAGREMSVAEVLAAVERPALPSTSLGTGPWVAITGGEPLLQVAEVNALIAAISERGRSALVETSGAYLIDAIDPRAVRIVDVKTPGSGMSDRMNWRNLDLVRPEDEVKFVLTGREDYEWAKGIAARHSLPGRTTVLFGAAEPALPAAELARWILDDGLAVRLNLQIHKYLHLP